MHKSDVRKLAKKYKLPTAEKKDSQGVCFLGPLDMKDFLKHYIESKKGDVLNTEGEKIGTHDGAVFFTLGERHGFTIDKHSSNDAPLYVVSKDVEKNTITVSTLSQNSSVGKEGKEVEIIRTNWISGLPVDDKKYKAQIRYHGEFVPCYVKIEGEKTKIIFDKNILVSSGQSIVVYDNNICLGGGVVI